MATMAIFRLTEFCQMLKYSCSCFCSCFPIPLATNLHTKSKSIVARMNRF
jgi:hypothetical protein